MPRDDATGGARTVDDVVARLEVIDGALPAGDGVACFNRMYLTVTGLVRDRLAAGSFADPVAMDALDVTFADLYLAAVDAQAGDVPKAWAPLFARRADPRVEPIQFAIAGMNAHINHDLAVAVVDTCLATGIEPADPTFFADYLAINEVLASVEREVRESYLDGPAPVLDLVGVWSIERARDAAWVNAGVLWHLRDLPVAREAFRDTLARSVGLATQTLLTPVL